MSLVINEISAEELQQSPRSWHNYNVLYCHIDPLTAISCWFVARKVCVQHNVRAEQESSVRGTASLL